jgi:hypothetical protein
MLTRLWSAVARVIDGAAAIADSLHDLAATFREANGNARQQLGLGAHPAVEQLPEPARNGRRSKSSI